LAAFPADQDVIGISHAMRRQKVAQQFAEAPLHAVADDGIADSFGHGDAVAQTRAAVGPGEQNEAGAGDAKAAVGGEKVRAARQDRRLDRAIRSRAIWSRIVQAESFLRPRARRARSTLRPPGVAVRARKP
jgi:hypothetical protein